MPRCQVSAAFPRRVVNVLDVSLQRVLHREELAADVALEAVLGVDVLRVPRQRARVAEALVALRTHFALLAV